jgi:hypothetical protein
MLGLDRWRKLRLQAIEERMIDLTEDHRAASEGLGIAHRNPGQVDQDVIRYLWDKLNKTAVELDRLEASHQELSEMDLSHLVVTFKQERQVKPSWDFQSF